MGSQKSALPLRSTLNSPNSRFQTTKGPRSNAVRFKSREWRHAINVFSCYVEERPFMAAFRVIAIVVALERRNSLRRRQSRSRLHRHRTVLHVLPLELFAQR